MLTSGFFTSCYNLRAMQTKSFPYTRIVVIGTTSSGKSTLAENLSKKLDLDFVELDALYWQPNWVGTPDEEFAA